MKTKLSPALSYILGIYLKKKLKKGIGISGNSHLLTIFSKECLDQKLTEPGKILYEKDSVYFYNSKLKKFIDSTLDDIENKFIFINDFSSSFFAGIFDSSFTLENNKICLGKYNLKEHLVLDKLGFTAQKFKNKICIQRRSLQFLKFIYPGVKLKKAEIEKLLKL